MKQLTDLLPQHGAVDWIGIRPARRAAVEIVEVVDISPGGGLAGDHYTSAGGKRQVTLIQAEHLEAVASMLGISTVKPETARRNIVVRGINLLALKGKTFAVGGATLEYTGLCHPCSLMESELGPGGYNAMRGHGGITAKVIRGGVVKLGDPVHAETPE